MAEQRTNQSPTSSGKDQSPGGPLSSDEAQRKDEAGKADQRANTRKGARTPGSAEGERNPEEQSK